MAGWGLALVGCGSTAPPNLAPEVDSGSDFEFNVVMVNRWGRIRKVERHRAEYSREFLQEGITLDGVKIPRGTFMMGTPEHEPERYHFEAPLRSASVPTFWMGKYLVTQAQWRAVAALPKVERDLDLDPSHDKGDRRPVETVSWWEAAEFCARLSRLTGRTYRLPSETEWEYACRAGTSTPFHFGHTIAPDLANYAAAGGGYAKGRYGWGPKGRNRWETTDVGSFNMANRLGLDDLHGNVKEWCLDHWHTEFIESPTDGRPWITAREEAARVFRGGTYRFGPSRCRSGYCLSEGVDRRFRDLGFRVVCEEATVS